MKGRAKHVGIPIKLVVSQLVLLVTVFVFFCGGLVAAEAPDFKTFAAQESYVVDGVPIVLTQKVDEATVKLRPSLRGGEADTLTATNGARLVLTQELPGRLGIYRFESGKAAAAAATQAAIDSLNQDDAIELAYPVYVNPSTGNRLFLNDEIVVQLKQSLNLHNTDIMSSFSLRIVDRLPGAENTYVLKLTKPKEYNPFKVCDALREREDVNWAEPNKTQEFQKFTIPDDTLFGDQWHLRNTGQTGATSDADVDADDAWDSGYGSPGIRIAILDDGVQTDHPDLEDNIVAGYDFFDDDDDPNPGHANDNHGTAVAGAAAAAVDNDTGVAGVAGRCQILPVRIAENETFASDSTIARALVYAADNADVINCSWGGGSPSGTLNTAFSYASSSGRGGIGCVVLCAAGNAAGGDGDNSYGKLQEKTLYPTLSAGNYFFGFAYVKDGSGSASDDCLWLADMIFPNGFRERFDSDSLPENWVTVGDEDWEGTIDPEHAHGTSQYAWRSGAIGNSQFSALISPLAVLNSTYPTLRFRTWISSQAGDEARLLVFDDQSQLVRTETIGDGTVESRTTAVAYPANLSTVLAVGATSDFDYRSHFSQYDATLDFVAPGGGGYAGIATTDRTGSDGYVTGDYVGIEGTSFSAPIASGIAALVLSENGKQTVAVVGDKMISTCDKIGPLDYDLGASPYRNNYYGYGRLNADAAVDATTADSTAPTFVSATVINHRAVDVEFSEPMGEGSLDPANYSVTAGQNTLSDDNPDHVVRVGLVVAGYNVAHPIYRLIWDSGDIAVSGTVSIQATSSIKDVAGNALSTTTKNSTGTKRQIAIDCGSGDEFLYKAPFYLDNGFQGNETTPAYLSSSDSSVITVYGTTISTTGISDPAPQLVYQSYRHISSEEDEGQTITYDIPDMPSSGNIVRVHITNLNDIYQYEVFDIYINESYKGTHYGGGTINQAIVYQYTGIGRDGSGNVQVQLVPQQSGYDDEYHASISGIEVLQP